MNGLASFESRAHEDLFRRCLQSGVVPPKFSYAGSAAYRHHILAATNGYLAVTDAIALEADMIRHFDPRQIAEIGPGTGAHTAALLRVLSVASPRYLGLDFSRTMLELAVPALQGNPDLAVWDVDEGPSNAIREWRSSGMVLSLMLGNTLANLDDPEVVLRHVRESLDPGDALLLSVNFADESVDPASIVAAYQTAEFQASVLESFRAANVDTGDLEVTFGDGELRAFVTLNDDGRRIQCFRSRRFSPGALEKALDGFKKVCIRRSGSLGVALVSV
ncbi:L-histidine N(alpha)-methyltransferase [Dactylosporangium cerinum]|uniref:L-histidine N(Alpha)-methyltransferase n=1 Tax=Dactylosporangium cerinum TaxID=1434730 RepID=A0ABV9W2Z4_9ACTN